MKLDPQSSVIVTDKTGVHVDLAPFRGRRIKKTHRNDDGSITAVLDLGSGVVGLAVIFATEQDYVRCRQLGD